MALARSRIDQHGPARASCARPADGDARCGSGGPSRSTRMMRSETVGLGLTLSAVLWTLIYLSISAAR